MLRREWGTEEKDRGAQPTHWLQKLLLLGHGCALLSAPPCQATCAQPTPRPSLTPQPGLQLRDTLGGMGELLLTAMAGASDPWGSLGHSPAVRMTARGILCPEQR